MSHHSIDPFDLLGVPARFSLSKAELESRQRELSKVLHPDRFALASSVERRAALNKAMSVNEAVRLLKDPVARGQALLQKLLRRGASAEQPEARVSPALLMQVMEWREELSSAFTRRDKGAVERVAGIAVQRHATLLGELDAGFERLARELSPTTSQATPNPGDERVAADASDASAVSHPDVEAILQGLAALKYLERLSEEVRRIEDELADAS